MPPTPWSPNSYPQTRRGDHFETYHSASRGAIQVPDPYQWLEENTDETDKWTTAQEAFTRTYLDKNPDLHRLHELFQKTNNFAKFSAPQLQDDNRWYWYHNSGLQPQTAFYRSKDGKLPDISNKNDAEVAELFFDPNVLSKDGTSSLTTYRFSECGKYFAYGISDAGSDFITIYIRPTDKPLIKLVDGKDAGRLPEELRFVKFTSITWTPDSKGFFYQRYPDNGKHVPENGSIATQGDRDAMIYYHRIGTPQSDDILTFQDKENPERMFSFDITEDGKYLILYVLQDSSRKHLLWIADFDASKIGSEIKWRKIVDEFADEYEIVTNKGSLFYIRTNKSAAQYKVITLDIDTNQTRDLIPESDAYLASITSFHKEFFALTYKRNVKDEVHVFSHSGKHITRLAKDFVGACHISGREKQSHFFVSMTGFTTPCTVGRYDFTAPAGQEWSIYRAVKLNGLVPEEFEARQVWYDSKDGTKIPMFIVHHKSTKLDGTAPAIQYGYGGFSISIDPFFSASILTFLVKYGAILAVPNIRGGGEFGEDWHMAGAKENKGNCFDDFIAATDYLVKHKYAARGKIALNGASNGGLLVAACVVRAPEGSFGAAVAEVGVHDLLKFHRFTIGNAWTCDYGNPDDPKDFDFIYPLSPLHNVPTDKKLPPTILLTADHDDRVVPMHSFKLAATLQHSLPHNPHPLLLRVDKKAGHGAGKSTLQKIKESADKWGFVAQSLGLVWKDHPVANGTKGVNGKAVPNP